MPEPLNNPISKERQRQAVEEEDGRIDVVVLVRISEVINRDLGEFFNLLSNRAIGNTLLMEIDYSIVGVREDGHTLHLSVTGFIPDDAVEPT